MQAYHLHKGIAYFTRFEDAKDMASVIPGSRIVRYGRGYAIQYRISGPYWPQTL